MKWFSMSFAFLIIIDFDFESFTIFLRLYEQTASHLISGGSDLTLARLWRVIFSPSVSTHVYTF